MLKNKKILLCCFSGTGNTLKVTLEFKKLLEEDNKVDLLLLDNKSINNIDKEYDLYAICYPIYAFNAPHIIEQMIKKFPKDKGYFIIKTSGEALPLNNNSSRKIIKIMKKRRNILLGEYHYIMPYNIMFRHSEAMAYKMWEYAKKKIKIDVDSLKDNINKIIKERWYIELIRVPLRIVYPGSRINALFMHTTKNCIMCIKCVQLCPMNNIEKKGNKIVIHHHCEMCMRCVMNCPKDAIHFGLLNKWKVNGKYSFEKPKAEEKDKHKNYCKKSYNQYFLSINNE